MPIWIFYILGAMLATGLITGWLKDSKFKKEMNELIMEILLAFQDGVITTEEAARLIKEAKDVFDAIKEIQAKRIEKATHPGG